MSDLEARVKKILDDATSSDGPVGCTFAAIDRSGKILVNVASGYEELGNQSRPAKPDSLYCLYSCTKAIATIAVMQLVEQGKISLDDHVGDKVPQVAAATLADGSKPNKPITLGHLLTHTAGFGYTFFEPEIKRWSENAGVDEFSGTLEGITSPLIAQPGEDWNYGVNIDWAGIYLEKVTGMTLGAYCKKHVFEPLGADDIEFGLVPQNKDRLVAMHQRGEDGTMTVRKHLEFTYKSSFDSAGAGCIGSIESYLKCVSILMNDGVGANGTRILKAETVQQMLQDHLGDVRTFSGADPMERRIPAATPELTHPIEMMPGVKKGWGLSFQILHDDLPHGRKAGSVWWAGLCNNYWQVDPTSGIATMILSQSFPFNDPKVIVPWITAEAEVYNSLQG
ncbi:beta-lactamase [Rhodotorula sp. JG-1b]|nr:beta-lactamase [Rhodotorula sp. JG-1b]